PLEKRRRVLRVVAFEKSPELLKPVPGEITEVKRRPVRVPMQMSVLKEVLPVGNVLVNRQGKTDALENFSVRRNPLPPSLRQLVIGSPSICHWGTPTCWGRL